MRTRRKKLVAVRLAPTTWQALKALANHNGQTVQALAEQILSRGLARLIEGHKNA